MSHETALLHFTLQFAARLDFVIRVLRVQSRLRDPCLSQCELIKRLRLKGALYALELGNPSLRSRRLKIQRKFVQPLFLRVSPTSPTPLSFLNRQVDELILPPLAATMDDCCRTAEMLPAAIGSLLNLAGSPCDLRFSCQSRAKARKQSARTVMESKIWT